MIDPTWAKGIDVSHHVPVRDFSAIPADVVMFGAKATEGDDFVDPTLTAHRDGARARGFDLVVYYHVARPGDGAAHARRVAQAVGPLVAGECIALDVERTSGVDVDYVEAFYAELAAMGVAAWVVYLSAGVYDEMGNPPWPRAGSIALWAPRYKSGGQPPRLPPPWSDWTVWQWTDGGQTGDPYSCEGVGACDASVFNGPRSALQAWVASR